MQVTRTYLEMRDPAALRGAKLDDPAIRIERQRDCSVDLFRFLYVEVGRNYHWIDRLPWTDRQIADRLTVLSRGRGDGRQVLHRILRAFDLRLSRDGGI